VHDFTFRSPPLPTIDCWATNTPAASPPATPATRFAARSILALGVRNQEECTGFGVDPLACCNQPLAKLGSRENTPLDGLKQKGCPTSAIAPPRPHSKRMNWLRVSPEKDAFKFAGPRGRAPAAGARLIKAGVPEC
jgi:hypothetical protein